MHERRRQLGGDVKGIVVKEARRIVPNFGINVLPVGESVFLDKGADVIKRTDPGL